MSTVSTQSQLPKGLNLSKKMKRFILFAIFMGLFMFSMSIFITERLHSQGHHYADVSVYKLAEEVRELKKSQDWSKKSIERLYNNQKAIVEEQNELREVKDSLLQELSNVENIAIKAHEAYHDLKLHIKQQDLNVNALMKNKGHNQKGVQDNSLAMNELHNALANKLEAFRKVLEGFEVKINTNNRKVVEDLREIRTWVVQNSVNKDEVNAVLQSNQNSQRQLLNEINIQKNLINQATQNSVKQGNEVKEVSRVLNGLKDYTLDAIQQLGQQNALNEKRINVFEKTKVPSGQAGRQSVGSDNGQLAVDLKNLKEYTMEALQELRSYNNKNTKRINHIQGKVSEYEMAPIGEMVSQEVEKIFTSLGDGKLLEKILQETNISMKELHTFVNIVKMLAEGDINGVMKVLNHVTGGNLMEQLMSAKEGLLKEYKPVLDILSQLSKGDGSLKEIMKYASKIGDYMSGEPKKETATKNVKANNNQKQQKAQKKKEYGLEDLFQLLE